MKHFSFMHCSLNLKFKDFMGITHVHEKRWNLVFLVMFYHATVALLKWILLGKKGSKQPLVLILLIFLRKNSGLRPWTKIIIQQSGKFSSQNTRLCSFFQRRVTELPSQLWKRNRNLHFSATPTGEYGASILLYCLNNQA